MKSLTKKYTIKAPVSKVWEALIDPKRISEWGGGPAKMKAEKGFKFSLWGGDIYGTNTEVMPEKKLVQDWYGGKWREPSVVSFTLSKHGDETEIFLEHTNIPDDEYEGINEGWDSYYLGPLQNLVEE